MKKLLLGSIALTLFSISILIFQIGCKKDVTAQIGATNYKLPAATTSTLGGIIVGNGLSVTPSGILSIQTSSTSQTDLILYDKHISLRAGNMAYEYWVCLKDGSNKRQILIPANITVSDGKIGILADKNSVVFSGSVSGTSGASDIYTMNIDGSNLQKIVSGDASTNLYSREVYW
jgi:hypothetical protein